MSYPDVRWHDGFNSPVVIQKGGVGPDLKPTGNTQGVLPGYCLVHLAGETELRPIQEIQLRKPNSFTFTESSYAFIATTRELLKLR